MNVPMERVWATIGQLTVENQLLLERVAELEGEREVKENVPGTNPYLEETKA